MIKYKKGYKYQLVERWSISTDLRPDHIVVLNPFLFLDVDGKLCIQAGYAWDGPSGPAIDTKNFMRGSLVHDALYQLMRENLLSFSFRKQADEELNRICLEDGMSKLRAWWVYQGVRFGGGPFASIPDEIETAP